jgi:hypothetical protein
MSHTCGVGEIPKPVELPSTDIAMIKDQSEAQLLTYYELLTIQNEQLKERDIEIKKLKEELYNVIATRELERSTTATQDTFTYLLLQRENTKLNEKVKALEELGEKIKAEYERQLAEFVSLAPPKLIRQQAISPSEQIETNNKKIKVLKKKMKSQSMKEKQEEKLKRMSQGRPSG